MAIIGLITGVAWPLFIEQGRVNNRTDAILATNAVALALTKYESDNGNFKWDGPPGGPGAVTVPNAHNRYLPLVPVGLASGTIADNICTENRGFRWVPGNARYESCRGNYSINVVINPPLNPDGSGASYTITTTAIAGLAQDRVPADEDQRDSECLSFILDNNGTKDYTPSAYLLTKHVKGAGNLHSVKRCWTSD